jgi:hypothetical protein
MGTPYIPPNFLPKTVQVTCANNACTYNGNTYTNPIGHSDNLPDGTYNATHFLPAQKVGYPADFIILQVPLGNQMWWQTPYNAQQILAFMSRLGWTWAIQDLPG